MAPGLGPWLLALSLAAGPAGESRAGRAASPGLGPGLGLPAGGPARRGAAGLRLLPRRARCWPGARLP